MGYELDHNTARIATFTIDPDGDKTRLEDRFFRPRDGIKERLGFAGEGSAVEISRSTTTLSLAQKCILQETINDIALKVSSVLDKCFELSGFETTESLMSYFRRDRAFIEIVAAAVRMSYQTDESKSYDRGKVTRQTVRFDEPTLEKTCGYMGAASQIGAYDFAPVPAHVLFDKKSSAKNIDAKKWGESTMVIGNCRRHIADILGPFLDKEPRALAERLSNGSIEIGLNGLRIRTR